LTKRIDAIVKRINNSDIVLDIGCDQALLGIQLAKKGIHSYASDIKKNIILKAEDKVKKLNLTKFITFIVSDGLTNINVGVNTLVLAGMGTHRILNILTSSKKTYKKIITISNNSHDILRMRMKELGYTIKEEEVILEKNKFYNLIEFEIGAHHLTKEEIIVGKNHTNKELLKQKNEYLLNKYSKLKVKRKEIQELIDIISKYVY